jgi:hypothetical protein
MTSTIDLPIPRDYPKRNDEIRALAEEMTNGSIVTQALERFLIQVLTEVHESQIRPLRTALKPLADLELPVSAEGNAGFYSIRFEDIKLARSVVKAEVVKE